MKRKLHRFAIFHDYIKLFVILYVSVSAIIAIFLGLFYFFLWILFHYALELYKRFHLFRGLSFKDFLIALQHCRIDFMFLFVGIAVEAVAEHSIALAPGRMGALIRAEREASLLFREARIMELLRSLPRAVGALKASKSVAQIAKELYTHKVPKEKEKLELDKIDVAVGLIVFISLLASSAFLFAHGLSVKEILKVYITALLP